MIDTEALRNNILKLAFQGKITEQKEKYGFASDLLSELDSNRIELEKQKISGKKKMWPAIEQSEKYFSIPATWAWCRIDDVFYHNTGKALNKKNSDGEQLTYITTSNLYWDRFVLDDLKEMAFSDDEVKKCTVSRGDLLVCEGGDFGRAAIWNYDFDTRIQNHVHRLRSYIPVETRYFYYVLYYYKHNNLINGVGIGLQGLSSNALGKMPIPLPPLEEQKQIVTKLDASFTELRKVDELQQQYANNINSLNNKILDLAVRGKLVPQNPNDEPASVLLKKIAEEKQKLIKEGKIKKQKALPAITEDEIPFDIPESWAWVRLGELCEVVTGRLDANAQDKNGKYPFFTCGEEVYTTKDYAFDCDAIQLGGNNAAGIYKMHRFAGKFNAYQRVYVISGRSKHEMDYIYCVIKFWLPSLRISSQGTTTRFIKLGQVTEMLVPYPPVNEQKRIVEKLSQAISDLSQMRGKTSKTHPVYYPKGLMEV